MAFVQRPLQLEDINNLMTRIEDGDPDAIAELENYNSAKMDHINSAATAAFNKYLTDVFIENNDPELFTMIAAIMISIEIIVILYIAIKSKAIYRYRPKNREPPPSFSTFDIIENLSKEMEQKPLDKENFYRGQKSKNLKNTSKLTKKHIAGYIGLVEGDPFNRESLRSGPRKSKKITNSNILQERDFYIHLNNLIATRNQLERANFEQIDEERRFVAHARNEKHIVNIIKIVLLTEFFYGLKSLEYLPHKIALPMLFAYIIILFEEIKKYIERMGDYDI
jgi:hypothetical protein